MIFRDLLEKRAKLTAEMRAIVDAPATGGDLSAEQAQRFDTLKAELATVETSIGRRQALDEAERRMEATPLANTGDERLDDALRGFSLRAAIASQVPDITHSIDAGRERELSAELARRAGRAPNGIMVPMQVFQRPLETRVVTTATPASHVGGNLIGTDHLGGQYIDILRARMVMQALGATVLNDLHGNVEIPKLEASATGHWVAENAAISASDPGFDPLTMAPRHVGAITEYSRNLLLQSSPDIEQLLRTDFASILANAVDRAAIRGGGSNEPDGILETAGIGSVSMSAGATWPLVLALISAVESANATGQAFLTNPAVVKKLRSTVRVTSTDSAMIMEGPAQLAGYPCAVTTNVPSNLSANLSPPPANRSALVFGDFSQVMIGYWSVFDLLVNPFESTAYAKGNVQIRGMVTCDVAIRQPGAFAAAQDLNPA